MEKRLTDQELQELVNLYPIMGGDGTDGGASSDATPSSEADPNKGDEGGAGDDGKKDDEGEDKPGDGGEPEPKGDDEPPVLTKGEDGVYRDAEGQPFLPKSRLDEETGKNRLLSDQLDRYRTPPKTATPPVKLSEDDVAFKADLERLYPELRALPQTVKQVAISQIIEDERVTTSMETRCDDLLTGAGFNATEQNRLDLEAVLGSRIARDPKLAQRFFKGDANVLNDVFKEVQPSLYAGANKAKEVRSGGRDAARTKSRLPAAVQKGAPPKQEPVVEVKLETSAEQTKHLHDVHDRAFARLQDEANRT